ncbi:MAG: hypothetical protein IJ457_01400 [Clostridia bacterium]|nr:hypothetical protein [Clostridia bacterium]
MFFKIYKTTIKRILRSPLFWMALIVASVMVFMNANGIVYGNDKQPDFVLAYHKYHEMISNMMRKSMLYIVPCLCVAAVMAIVTGDYTDNFFEIERAGGVKSASYFFGRLLGLFTILFTVMFIFSFFSVHYYFFTRGGVANFTGKPDNFIEPWPFHTLKEYILDSTKVILRLVAGCQLPVIILFTTATYAIGTVLESGVLAAIGGSIGVVFSYLGALRYQWAFNSTIYRFFLPAKIGPYLYLSRYDTVFATEKYTYPNGYNIYLSDTLEDVVMWLAVLLGISLACIVISYIFTRRRKI